jgi:hypothetical protein
MEEGRQSIGLSEVLCTKAHTVLREEEDSDTLLLAGELDGMSQC